MTPFSSAHGRALPVLTLLSLLGGDRTRPRVASAVAASQSSLNVRLDIISFLTYPVPWPSLKS